MKNPASKDTIKIPNFVSPRNVVQSKSNKDNQPKQTLKQSKNQTNGLLKMLDFSSIEMDSDRSIILMLIALLSGKNNESDELLMLALMYIML